MKVVGYARVSTEEQTKDGFSLEAQKERIYAFAHSQGWDLLDFYIDEGYSGKNMQRPQMQRLIAHVREN